MPKGPTLADRNRNQLESGSPRTRAFEIIRDGIFSGRLSPGDLLKELHLARELGVSQATVREALIRLEHVGLVVRTPNWGTRVTNLSRKDHQDRLKIRAALEEMACVDALARADTTFFRGLETHLEAMAEACSERGPFDLAQQDFEFHRYIWRQSDNQLLRATLEQISAPLFASVGLLRGRGNPQKLEAAVQLHVALIEAFRTGDESTVRESIRHHIFGIQAEFFGICVSDSLHRQDGDGGAREKARSQ